jgi:signal peptidase I
MTWRSASPSLTFARMTPSAISRKLLVSGLWAGALGASLFLGGCDTTYHPYRVNGESMLPLLRPGDRIFVDESDHARSDLHDGEVVALRRNDAIVLKRLVAVPGETLSGVHRKVFHNGKQLDEPYLAPATDDERAALATFTTRTVGQGELFVMGDNRDVSLDSRAREYAQVLISDAVGKYRWTSWHTSSVAKQD